MLQLLLGLIPGALSTINGITGAISNEKIALINAKTAQEQIEIGERIAALQSRRDLMIAESAHSNINAYIRAGIAIGPMTFLLKVFLWDKVLGALTAGRTDALDANLWNVIMAVVGFYFLYEGATTVARIVKS